MAEIVLGIATAHTPLFTLDAHEWEHRAAADRNNPRLNLSDGRWVTYEQLLAQTGPRWADEARPEVLIAKAAACDAALERLGDALEQAAPDAVIIVGDDQGEMFGPANQPAFAIYHAEQLHTSNLYGHESSPDWVRKMGRGYLMDVRHTLAGHAALGLSLIEGLMDEGVDVTSVAQVGDDPRWGLGHAFGFIANRLFRGRAIPMVPLLLNTYYPPNVPSASRCLDIGKAVRRVLQADASGLRVAVIASGGLSHFVVDEGLDRRVMKALVDKDEPVLRGIERAALNSGSSEILNWVMTGGIVQHLKAVWSEYLPLQRTPAGTGVGAGFIIWR